MIFRDVEAGEVVVGKLDLRTVQNLKAHGDEQLLRLVQRDVHRVAVTQPHGVAGDGHVHRLGAELCLQRLFLEAGARFFKLILDGGAHVVRDLTHHRALLRGELAHHLEHARQLALFAKEADAQRVQLIGALDRAESIERFLTDLFKLLFHITAFSFVKCLRQLTRAHAVFRGAKRRRRRSSRARKRVCSCQLTLICKKK